MAIVLIGLNHRTATVEIREQLALAGDDLKQFLADVQDKLGLDEVCVLSTCNRLEIYAVVEDKAWQTSIRAYLGRRFQSAETALLDPHLYALEDAAAVEHLMRVAGGLESMIVGEPQILGQVNEAMQIAQNGGSLGPILSQLLMKAINAGKRARTDTAISRHTTSVSHAAALLAQDARSDLGEIQTLIIGAGEMALQAVKALHARGVMKVTVINRTYENAKTLAEHFGGVATHWSTMADALIHHDLVISATGSPHLVLTQAMVKHAMTNRDNRPLLIIDIAVPRDVEARVGELAGVTLYDIDDLQHTVDGNIAQRQAAMADVEAIIDEGLVDFLEWLDGRQVVPVITDLRRKAEAIVQAELEQALRRLDGIDPHGQKVVQRMAHRIVNKLLYAPTSRLKSQAVNGNGDMYATVVRDLFHLDEENGFHPSAPERGQRV